jgi:4,5-dihydroxyphthalate decarboxylase
MTLLSIAVGRHPHTAPVLDGRVPVEGCALDVRAVEPITKAFAPMVRTRAYQVSEMALGTFLMAKAWGKPLVLLPVTIASRPQQRAFFKRADAPIRTPADLKGKRVGVRSYSQTTGLWLRGAVGEAYGLAPDAMRWVTFEDAHVAEFRDPPFVARAKAGETLDSMLRAGALDAAIFGLEAPSDPAFRPLFDDADAEAAAFERRHGFAPVNHVLACDADVAERHGAALTRAFHAAAALAGGPARGWPQSRATLAAPVALAAEYALRQGLVPRALAADEIWAGSPPDEPLSVLGGRG